MDQWMNQILSIGYSAKLRYSRIVVAVLLFSVLLKMSGVSLNKECRGEMIKVFVDQCRFQCACR